VKKLIIFIIYLISFSYTTKAFLGEDLWSNLYNNIDSGFEEMEFKQYEYELSWQWESIKDNINKILKIEWLWECINKELTSETVEKISNWNIGALYEVISEECKEEKTSININKITNIQDTIRKINEISKSKSAEKTKQINNISRIWIYSDWSIKNSPFDLITDLDDINSIIFSSEIIYEWEEYTNNDDLIKNLFEGNSDLNNLNLAPLIVNLWTTETNSLTIETGSWTNTQTGSDTNNLVLNNTTKDICISDSEETWLNEETLNNIFKDINDNITNNWNNFEQWNNNNPQNILTSTNENLLENSNTNSVGAYKSVNDNSMWPCNNFFCITIEFITYNHQLLGWWKNISIEYLINRSNEHLKKFASTSLMPANMTINNFELWFKNIKLSDLFHMWFVIQSKPIPILEIEKEDSWDKKEKWEFTKTNLLEKYYKNLWLEYERKNDINIFRSKEEELKTIIDSAELTNNDIVEKLENLEKNKRKNENKNDFVDNTILKKVWNDELTDFEKQFLELRKFSSSIKSYVESINVIIKAMKDIPTYN
jgi:hypothetical protein